jgi:hypothetical protein
MLLPSVTNRHSKLWSECIADRPTSAESQSEEEQGPRHLTSLNVKILGPTHGMMEIFPTLATPT